MEGIVLAYGAGSASSIPALAFEVMATALITWLLDVSRDRFQDHSGSWPRKWKK